MYMARMGYCGKPKNECLRTVTARAYCGSGIMGKVAGLREDESSRSLM
jgi:hypothetical protein